MYKPFYFIIYVPDLPIYFSQCWAAKMTTPISRLGFALESFQFEVNWHYIAVGGAGPLDVGIFRGGLENSITIGVGWKMVRGVWWGGVVNEMRIEGDDSASRPRGSHALTDSPHGNSLGSGISDPGSGNWSGQNWKGKIMRAGEPRQQQTANKTKHRQRTMQL